MSKYIDADKLIAEIKRYKNKADERLKIKGRTFSEERKDLALQNLCGNLLYFINSLQQEQPEPVCKTCGFYENNCPFIRGKLIPYPNKVCKDYTYSAMKEQEQPEAELKKEIELCWMNWLSPSNQKEVEGILPKTEFEMYARHFYELGLNARNEK